MTSATHSDTDSRTQSVMDAIRHRIAGRKLTPSDRLPSIRGMAASVGVSPSTVVEAYDRLAAEGLIRARRGSGFYVSATALPPLSLIAPTNPPPQSNHEIPQTGFPRESCVNAAGIKS